MRIAVLSSATAWHFLDLKRAAGDAHDVFNIPFEQLGASIVSENGELSRDAAAYLPIDIDADCVVVRTMPSGSVQQIVFRMDLLGQLADSGMLVLNSPRSIEIAVDKYLSLAILNSSGIPVPATRVSQTVAMAIEHYEQLGADVVMKPLFGSMGNGICRIQNSADARSLFERHVQCGDVIYQQEFIDHPGFDIRILVIGDSVLAMKRVNGSHWITNIAQGGIGERYEASNMEKRLAIRAARAVGAQFAGVDLMYRRDSDRPIILEVNAVPGWRAISDVLEIDVAKLVVSDLEVALSPESD